MQYTISELARAVGKSENYVRQHINRKHLTVQREGRKISVAHEEAARWAHVRHLSFVPPIAFFVSGETSKKRIARMTVLTHHCPGEKQRNLFTLIRHRREEAQGPWVNEPSKTWTSEDIGNGLRLYSLDTSLIHCQELVDEILESATLVINGVKIDYALEPNPRRHRVFRNYCKVTIDSVPNPFSHHSAKIVEYWSLAAKPRRNWLEILDHNQALLQLSGLGFPLDRLTDRVGNLMIVGAEDEITCDLAVVGHDHRTLRLSVDTEKLLPGDYRATVWASYSGDEVFRREIPVMQSRTSIKLESDVDHIGFSIFRTSDGQCIDLMEVFLILQISGHISVNSGSKMELHDGQSGFVHKVSLASPFPRTDINVEAGDAGLDKEIRQQWLDRRVREREVAMRREGNLERFGPGKSEDARQYMVNILREDADQNIPIYLADPYFETTFEGNGGTDVNLKKKLYCDIFAATVGTPLRILCAKKQQGSDDPSLWWSIFPEYLTAHVSVRSFLHKDGKSSGFHDRYLITAKREIIITHSLNGWHKDGVTFVRAPYPYDAYRTEAEQLWSMDVESPTTRLLVREIA